jgi:hypothetical protein
MGTQFLVHTMAANSPSAGRAPRRCRLLSSSLGCKPLGYSFLGVVREGLGLTRHGPPANAIKTPGRSAVMAQSASRQSADMAPLVLGPLDHLGGVYCPSASRKGRPPCHGSKRAPRSSGSARTEPDKLAPIVDQSIRTLNAWSDRLNGLPSRGGGKYPGWEQPQVTSMGAWRSQQLLVETLRRGWPPA